MGVNPEFRNHSYYGPILWKDHSRVSSKFDTAASKGIVIEKKTVSNETLLEHLGAHGPIIVLTDGNKLYCDLCGMRNCKPLLDLR